MTLRRGEIFTYYIFMPLQDFYTVVKITVISLVLELSYAFFSDDQSLIRQLNFQKYKLVFLSSFLNRGFNNSMK